MHVVSWKSVFSQVIWYYPNTHGRRHLPCVWSLQSSVTTPSWCTCLCRLLCSIRTLAEKSILHNHWRLFLHHCDKAKWRCRHFALHVPWGACPFCRQDGKEVCPGVHDNGGLVQLRSARIPDTGTIFPCWGCDMRKDGSGLPSYIAHFWLRSCWEIWTHGERMSCSYTIRFELGGWLGATRSGWEEWGGQSQFCARCVWLFGGLIPL